MRLVITSGYFDPLHVGHLECLYLAKQLGDQLAVIVNSDRQAKIKKGRSFMDEDDRLKIIQAVKWVDMAMIAIDDDQSVNETIREIYKNTDYDEYIFAKGGDRVISQIAERIACEELGIKIVDGLGDKIRSSSDLTGIKELK